jgi:hypothetical protein
VSNDNDDFMGSGAKSVQFEQPGDTVTGLVLATPKKQQQTDPNSGEPKTFTDGSPRYIFTVPIQTELRDPEDPFDTGERTLFLKWKSLEAVRNAVRVSGAKGLMPGGILTLTLTGFGPKTKAAWNPPKLWAATYLPPDGNEEFMASGQPIQSAAPAPPAQDQQRVLAQQKAAIDRLRAQRAGAQQPDTPPY